MSRRIEDLDPRCQDAARKTLDALTADDELRNSGVAGWLIVETRREHELKEHGETIAVLDERTSRRRKS